MREVSAPPGTDPTVATTMATVKLKIKPDGTFELTEMGFGLAGSASLGGDTGTLHVERMLDRNLGTLGDDAQGIKRERKIRLEKDGTLTYEAPDEGAIVLKRVKEE